MVWKKVDLGQLKALETVNARTYSSRYFAEDVPKYEIPEKGMPPDAAYQLIHDELSLEGNPMLNLASFVTTWMEPNAERLILENIHKNFVDHPEYPQTQEIHKRCVNMLARLYHAPEIGEATGTATIGSSEAAMLGLLAHKWSWKKRRQAEGNSFERPNVVFGADVHCCWEKFAKYFDVEMRKIPLETGRYTITAGEVEKRIDENTICVGAVLGTTFTGQVDPVKEIDELLERIRNERGWDVPIHVDAASGGFIAPFAYPDLQWDFRLGRVKSINTSGHKYGLVYPGVGWLIFRDKQDLPEELIFSVNYLGENMPTYTLNFSSGSSMVLGQYYNFLRLGRKGYREVVNIGLENARYLAEQLQATGRFELLGKDRLLPLVTAKLREDTKFTLFDLAHKLREHGWTIPVYRLPPNADNVVAMRVVVRESFSRDTAEMLLKHINEACALFERYPPPPAKELSNVAPEKANRSQHVC